MKTPWWESSPNAVVNLLVTKLFVKMDLYTIFLQGGGVLRYATGLVDVQVPGGYYWYANAIPPEIEGGTRTRAHYKIGADVDTWQFSLMPRPADRGGNVYPDRIGSVPWTQAVRAGMLDGSYIQVDRAVFPSWPTGTPPQYITPTGVVTIFYGPTAAIDFDRAATIISVQSLLQLLTQQTPRNVFQSGCRHSLFDTGCGLSASSFVQAGTALAGSTRSAVVGSIATPGGSGTYELGHIVMTSGLNNGFTRGIRKWSDITGLFTLIVPFPFDVAPGDTFDGYPGCDKSMANCTAFSNLDNFGGEPYTPTPETAI